jgi:hypothetical protein
MWSNERAGTVLFLQVVGSFFLNPSCVAMMGCFSFYYGLSATICQSKAFCFRELAMEKGKGTTRSCCLPGAQDIVIALATRSAFVVCSLSRFYSFERTKECAPEF